MMFSHNSLENYYTNSFSLMQFHKWDNRYLDNLMPWERALYVQFLEKYLAQKKLDNK